MQINLDFLKFHYFYSSKKLNNLSSEKYKEFFDDIFYNDNQCLVNVLKCVNDSMNHNSFISLHKHILKGKNEESLKYVIKTEHRNLYENLLQYFENSKKITYWQVKLGKSERLIYVTRSNIFIPILFDLKHCFYPFKDKNYDNNFNKMNYRWNFKDKQKEIKKKILKLIGK